jgi:cytidylate kinase
MNSHVLPDQLAGALIRASHHWVLRHGTPDLDPLPHAPWALTIAISREVGAYGTSVAHEVGKQLGWLVYDHELLELIAREMKLRVDLLESVDERHVGWLQERAEAFFAGTNVTESSYVQHLIQTVLSLATHGESVIVGRGAAQILPAASTLRVRLIAPLEDRITRICRERGLTRQEAARYVETTDRGRLRFIKDHFHIDGTDPRHYDLVLNASRWSVDEMAATIIDTAQQRCARMRSNMPVAEGQLASR